ncbi:MAG: 2OG-Fe(II) oxygenase [Novosphingobium sp.]|nr:2OG-Fe(II) oxygenase [Novosphingobium sp.]
MKTAANPDKSALAKVGAAVRKRIEADPSVYKVPVGQADIYAVSDFLSKEECQHLAGLVDDVAKPSQIFEEVYQHNYRTSYSGDVDQNDSFIRMVERRLGDLLGLELSWGESVQGQRYYPGQEFKEHCDWFDTQSEYWKEEVRRGGQRSWTAMVFLNNVEEGGSTAFPQLGIDIPPQQGALLLWNNADPDGVPNGDTLHAAQPVVRGAKYVITKWFRTRPWN